MVVTEEQRGERRQSEQAGRELGQLVEGEIQVYQVSQVGHRWRQSGEEAKQGFPLGVIKAVSFNEKGTYSLFTVFMLLYLEV